ncbi:hypothetical protein NL676_004111 [Syzygium grande]|nr:hypothetical protein NL676_004111 [Syzygium grande]
MSPTWACSTPGQALTAAAADTASAAMPRPTTSPTSIGPSFEQERMWLKWQVFALAKLMNVKEDHYQLSAIARKVQVVLCAFLNNSCLALPYFKEENGSDSLPVQLADENHWDELVIIICGKFPAQGNK